MKQEYIYTRTCEIIKDILKENDVVCDDIHAFWEENLVTSLVHIQIIVALENEFLIEFEDKYLEQGEFKMIKEVSEYIEEKLKISK